MGTFGAAHPELCHTYPTIIKLGTVILYLKKIDMNHVTHTMTTADISIFSPEISKFCYIKKYRYRLHLAHLAFLESLRICLVNLVIISIMSAKMAILDLLKILVI